jgi:hypothetical protein
MWWLQKLWRHWQELNKKQKLDMERSNLKKLNDVEDNNISLKYQTGSQFWKT